MQEVTGSSPVSPTIKNNGLRIILRNPFSFGAHLDAVFQGILNMKRIGILAYGSLIDNPGPELGPNTATKIKDVNTPFMVEFAWSDLAIARTIPCLLAFFSLVTLIIKRLYPQGKLPIETTAWYHKTKPTFADCLLLVRRHLWQARFFTHSNQKLVL